VADSNLRYFEINSGDALARNKSLLFVADAGNIREPYRIWYQVKNHGKECVSAGVLRGDNGECEWKSSQSIGGRYQRSESTAYRGKHWIKFFLVTNDGCVAESQKFIVNIVA